MIEIGLALLRNTKKQQDKMKEIRMTCIREDDLILVATNIAYLPGRYNFECSILSIIPPVLPILKQPGLTPPTVAGPIMETPFSFANLIKIRVMFSGIPSAIMAIVRILNNNC